MSNQYLTGHTSSLDEFSQALEYLIPGSSIESKGIAARFYSLGDGLISDGFFVGKNLTKALTEIEIRDSKSCILSIPSKGSYSTRHSHKPFNLCSSEIGTLFLPTDSIQYCATVEEVEDLIVILSYDELSYILERNFNILRVDQDAFDLDARSEKFQVIFDFLNDILRMVRVSPHLIESPFFKTNIRHLAQLLLAELIAEVCGADFSYDAKQVPDIVKRAEELMDAHPQKYFSVQEVANEVFTSPRNLQHAFHKYRNYTPMQFLKERKLFKARELLINPERVSRVQQIAYECGFLNLSSFSKYYREYFNELPSTTLKKFRQ